MVQRVQVEGMGVLEFPDGMSDADMSAAIQRNVPKSPQQSGAQQAAKETGFGEAAMVSAGRSTSNILDGLTQLYLKATGDKKALGGLSQNREAREVLYAPLAKERPVATGIGGALPSLAIPGAGAGYLGAAVAGGLPELLSYGSTEERLKKGGVGAAGGVAGRAIGGLLSAAIKPAGAGSKVSQDALDAAKRIGYKPLAGQATQNPALLNVENYLARTPGSSGTMQALADGNTNAINTAASKSVGQTGADISPSLLSAAQSKIGSEFDRLQSVTAPVLGDDFTGALLKIEQSNAALGSFREPGIDSLLDKALDMAAQGNLSGNAYKEIRTQLSNQANKSFKTGDATVGQAFKSVRKALDTAAEKSLSPQDQFAWNVAREQWGNWKTLTKGMVAEGGNVSPARVAAQLRAGSPSFRTGATQGPLADVARVGESFKTAQNPNSGNLLQAGTWGPVTIPANFMAAKIYTNPAVQKYLRDGLLDIGKGGELIVRATGVPLGVAETKSLLGVE